MRRIPRLSRRGRWAVPGGALVLTGALMAAALMPSAQAAPVLPARTAAQLVADVAARPGPVPFTGTVSQTASLGLPQLPDTQSATSPLSLLTGSHTFQVWFASPRHYRLAMPGKMSETDLYRDGGVAWLWQSVPDTVTKFVYPDAEPPAPPAGLPRTPQQAASDVLAVVGPTTTVRVDRAAYVAGQAAYELVLAPKNARSLVGQVRIAIDAQNNTPLRVEVYAKNATSPAISVGFTSITFTAPSAGDLAFTPPAGAKVTTVNLGGGRAGPDARDGQYGQGGQDFAVIGSDWLTVLKLPASALTSASSGPGEGQAAIAALLGSAASVHGTWGSGQLIRTSLVSVLISGGAMYVGAVDPSVLYAAAAQH